MRQRRATPESVLPFGFRRQNYSRRLRLPHPNLASDLQGVAKGLKLFSGEGLFFTGLLSASGVHRPGLPTWRCRGLLEQDPSSSWSTALSAACLLPLGSNDRPTVAREPFRGMRDGFCAGASPIPMSHSQVEGRVSVAAGGSARTWIAHKVGETGCHTQLAPGGSWIEVCRPTWVTLPPGDAHCGERR